jgi:hypothetical protein
MVGNLDEFIIPTKKESIYVVTSSIDPNDLKELKIHIVDKYVKANYTNIID